MEKLTNILNNVNEGLSQKELEELLWTPVMFSTAGLNAISVDGWHFGFINDIKDPQRLGVNIMPGSQSGNIYPRTIVRFEDFQIKKSPAFPKGALDIKKYISK